MKQIVYFAKRSKNTWLVLSNTFALVIWEPKIQLLSHVKTSLPPTSRNVILKNTRLHWSISFHFNCLELTKKMSRINPQEYVILNERKFGEMCSVLGVKELCCLDPDRKIIEKAFRRNALKCHPDKGSFQLYKQFKGFDYKSKDRIKKHPWIYIKCLYKWKIMLLGRRSCYLQETQWCLLQTYRSHTQGTLCRKERII